MSMIKCPECGHHISSKAHTCPECGMPIDPEWAAAEENKMQQQEKIDAIPFVVESNGEEVVEQKPVEAPAPEVAPKQPKPVQPVAQPTPQPAAAPEQPKNDKKNYIIIGVIVAILLVAFIGMYFYDNYRESQQEELAYEQLKDCTNPAFYEDFIIRYPDSKYIEEVRERYHEVASQNDEWLAIKAVADRDKLAEYARMHPTSPFVNICKDMIDSIDWFDAKRTNTMESVQNYMDTHRDGQYYALAESTYLSLKSKAEAAKKDTVKVAATDSTAATN